MPKIKAQVFSVTLTVILLSGLLMGIASAKPLTTIINVSTAAQLTAALTSVQPGDTIQLADGTYTGNFVATISGTASAPITLQGSRLAILNGNSLTAGYVLHLNAVNYWKLIGFTVTNGQKGIMTDNANYNLIDGVRVYNIGYEGVHFRTFSTHNTIQNSLVTDTGVSNTSYGEGIYLGSANSNWATYTGGLPDTSDANRVLNNHIGPNVSAEAVDIKEGTTGGEISGNYFESAGLSGANSADSWVDVKGNDYLISGNTGVIALLDGFQTHIQLSGWGDRNIFKANNANVQASGYGFKIQTTGSQGTASGNIVYDDNVVTNAASGVANIPLTVSGGSGATATPSRTATAQSMTATPTLGISPTRTATVGISATTTKTFTPAASITATRTPTVGITRTLTRTPTQIVGASNTPSATTARTATATITPTSGAGACSPVNATITTGFVFDGAGSFCWQASTLGTYINSWNTASVSVNGTNYTNLYVAVSALPAKINGFWYITYNSTVTWGHIEAK